MHLYARMCNHNYFKPHGSRIIGKKSPRTYFLEEKKMKQNLVPVYAPQYGEAKTAIRIAVTQTVFNL